MWEQGKRGRINYAGQLALVAVISTLRQFSSMPRAFVVWQSAEPRPVAVMFVEFRPLLINAVFTASARFWDSGLFIASVPLLSVWPVIFMQYSVAVPNLVLKSDTNVLIAFVAADVNVYEFKSNRLLAGKTIGAVSSVATGVTVFVLHVPSSAISCVAVGQSHLLAVIT